MEIREYQSADCKEIAELFYQTVHTVNAKDYTKEQLDVWATGIVDLKKWDRSFCEHDTVVAIEDGQIVGFGDMDDTGYLDRLYVHADYQRKGIASAICDRLERKRLEQDRQEQDWMEQKEAEQTGAKKITTHASITARPFFEKRGYRVVKEQQVNRQGIYLTNYVMEKE